MKLLLLLLLVSCASMPDVDPKKMAKVKVLLKSDAPNNCKEIREVIAVGNIWTGQHDYDNIKRVTAAVGGDLFVKTQDMHGAPGSVYGLAYKCK